MCFAWFRVLHLSKSKRYSLLNKFHKLKEVITILIQIARLTAAVKVTMILILTIINSCKLLQDTPVIILIIVKITLIIFTFSIINQKTLKQNLSNDKYQYYKKFTNKTDETIFTAKQNNYRKKCS